MTNVNFGGPFPLSAAKGILCVLCSVCGIDSESQCLFLEIRLRLCRRISAHNSTQEYFCGQRNFWCSVHYRSCLSCSICAVVWKRAVVWAPVWPEQTPEASLWHSNIDGLKPLSDQGCWVEQNIVNNFDCVCVCEFCSSLFPSFANKGCKTGRSGIHFYSRLCVFTAVTWRIWNSMLFFSLLFSLYSLAWKRAPLLVLANFSRLQSWSGKHTCSALNIQLISPLPPPHTEWGTGP